MKRMEHVRVEPDEVRVAVVNSQLGCFKIGGHVMPVRNKNLALGRPQVKS